MSAHSAVKTWPASPQAFLEEFSSSDSVSLWLRVSTDDANKQELAAWLSERFCAAAYGESFRPISEGSQRVTSLSPGERDQASPDVSPVVEASGLCPGLSKAWGALPQVVLLDEIMPQPQLPSLYKAADAFVLPSRGEGWGR